MDIQPEMVHIKTWDTFQSTRSGEPFKHCSSCRMDLLQGYPQYLIVKAFELKAFERRSGESEVLNYEYVVCQDCLSQLFETFSSDSAERVHSFAAERYNLDSRARALLDEMKRDRVLDVRRWLRTCILTGLPSEQLNAYRIVGHGYGGWLSMAAMPLLVSEAGLSHVERLLSPATTHALVNTGRKWALPRFW